MRFLSSSASAPKTVMITFPTGVLVSILSETEMKCKPHGYSCPNEELAFPDEEKQNPREEITFPAQEKQNANEESAFPDEEKQNPNEELTFPDEEKQNPRVEITLPAQEKQNPSEEGSGFSRLRFGSSRLVRYSPRRPCRPGTGPYLRARRIDKDAFASEARWPARPTLPIIPTVALHSPCAGKTSIATKRLSWAHRPETLSTNFWKASFHGVACVRPRSCSAWPIAMVPNA